MNGWMIFTEDGEKAYPCIVYKTKEKCQEEIEGLKKIDPEQYSNMTAQKVEE